MAKGGEQGQDQRVGFGALAEIAADTGGAVSVINSAFEQEGGPLTGLHRATAPSGKLTEYPVHGEGSDDG